LESGEVPHRDTHANPGLMWKMREPSSVPSSYVRKSSAIGQVKLQTSHPHKGSQPSKTLDNRQQPRSTDIILIQSHFRRTTNPPKPAPIFQNSLDDSSNRKDNGNGNPSWDFGAAGNLLRSAKRVAGNAKTMHVCSGAMRACPRNANQTPRKQSLEKLV
jgi:hypothetical protein